MVSQDSVNKQLKKIDFNPGGWNHSEINELSNILLPDEEIYECVNGIYEGGFALLVASDVRVLLVDKKPMGFLNVEDFRFDMINEIDYNHRIVGANIRIATGSKTLNFRSYNKERLRKLIGHVQHCMADNKKKQSSTAESQHQHLEQINQQLQAYLVAQHKQQQKLQDHLIELQKSGSAKDVEPPEVEGVEMSSQLKDYLYAKGLMEEYKQSASQNVAANKIVNEEPDISTVSAAEAIQPDERPAAAHAGTGVSNQLDEIYADGIQEVFRRQLEDKQPKAALPAVTTQSDKADQTSGTQRSGVLNVFEVNPLKIAYRWLPHALRSRKFGLSMPSIPSPFSGIHGIHTHSRSQPAPIRR